MPKASEMIIVFFVLSELNTADLSKTQLDVVDSIRIIIHLFVESYLST